MRLRLGDRHAGRRGEVRGARPTATPQCSSTAAPPCHPRCPPGAWSWRWCCPTIIWTTRTSARRRRRLHGRRDETLACFAFRPNARQAAPAASAAGRLATASSARLSGTSEALTLTPSPPGLRGCGAVGGERSARRAARRTPVQRLEPSARRPAPVLLLTPRAVSAPVSEQLQEVDLSKNKLSGQMPGAGFDRLSLLDLSGNTFSYPPPQALKRACAGSKLACPGQAPTSCQAFGTHFVVSCLPPLRRPRHPPCPAHHPLCCSPAYQVRIDKPTECVECDGPVPSILALAGMACAFVGGLALYAYFINKYPSSLKAPPSSLLLDPNPRTLALPQPRPQTPCSRHLVARLLPAHLSENGEHGLHHGDAPADDRHRFAAAPCVAAGSTPPLQSPTMVHTSFPTLAPHLDTTVCMALRGRSRSSKLSPSWSSTGSTCRQPFTARPH